MSVSKTRQHLINVARELFATRGLETTTMNDIAVASQRGRRTLYTYFRSKEEVYAAVIASELERLSENLDQVAGSDLLPDEKIFSLIYTHLEQIKETVARNGSLKAEFFGNIADVERARRAFDMEEIFVLRRILSEGVQQGCFVVENIVLTADIIHYAIKGFEVPYILDRMGEGVGEEEAESAVRALLKRALSVKE